MIDPGLLSNQGFVSTLRSSQIDYIRTKSNKYTTAQKNNLRDHRRQILLDEIAAGTGPGRLQQMGAKEIAGTPIATLTNVNLLPAYTPNMLKRMAQEMSTADIQTLRTLLLAHGNPDTISWLINPNTGFVEFS